MQQFYNRLAFIVENAGGKASTCDQRILDIKPKGIHERLPLFIGSKKDVEMAESHLASTVKKGGWFKWLGVLSWETIIPRKMKNQSMKYV